MVIVTNQASVPLVGGEVEQIRGARRKLRQVRQILMTPSPEQLGECGPVMEEAAVLLRSLVVSGMRGARRPLPGPELHEELKVLRRELTVVTALMEQAA